MAKTVVHKKPAAQKKQEKSVYKKTTVQKKKVVHKKNKAVIAVAYEENEGDLSEIDDEAPAHQKLRGQTALVTAACPRKYLKFLAQRMAKNQRIPEDFSNDEFLTKFRRVFNANCNQSIQKAGRCIRGAATKRGGRKLVDRPPRLDRARSTDFVFENFDFLTRMNKVGIQIPRSMRPGIWPPRHPP